MTEEFTYHDYVNDEGFLKEYNAYQSRYAENIRESDKVIISMVQDLVAKAEDRRLKILDIGCSTGNLLMHLKRIVPDADYVGGDLAVSSLDVCRKNPDLEGVVFKQLDIMNMPENAFDVIIVNAVLYMFDDEQYEKSFASLYASLREGGKVILFDFGHPFEHQTLTIYETSLLHPDGLRLCFRPMAGVRKTAQRTGYECIDIQPFNLPIDLKQPGYDEEVSTYTVDRKDGLRMMFRGALFQPWCHMIAHKA